MFQQFPPGLRNLVILIGLFGFAQLVLPRTGFDVSQLYLSYFASDSFRPWQLITHIFCHGGIGHFLFNMIALISFGIVMENQLGMKRFLYLFFISAMGAVAVQFISQAVQIAQLNDGHFMLGAELKMRIHETREQAIVGIINDSNVTQLQLKYLEIGRILNTKVLGASGALYGILIGFVFLYPNERLVFLFIPYPIKAKFLIPVLLALDVFLGFGSYSWDPIAHFAHIGGALAGFITLKIWAWNRVKNNWK